MGHFYDSNGKPCHTIVGTNGKERDTTIRDAKKHGWVASVTTIIQILHSYGLTNWMVDQGILAALTFPCPEDVEPLSDEHIKLIKADSKRQAEEAAERGSQIHDACEFYWENGYIHTGVAEDIKDISMAACNAIEDEYPDEFWVAEKRFSTSHFGGMVDLHSANYIIDYKGKDIKDEDWDLYISGNKADYNKLKRRYLYDNHIMQLSAYAVGLEMPEAKLVNVFIDRQIPGRVIILEHDEHNYELFHAALTLFLTKNKWGI